MKSILSIIHYQILLLVDIYSKHCQPQLLVSNMAAGNWNILQTLNLQLISEVGFVGNYTGAYTRNITDEYTGAYTRNFTGTTTLSPYSRAFSGQYTGTFSRDFTNDFVGNYSRDFSGQYTGNYSRIRW